MLVVIDGLEGELVILTLALYQTRFCKAIGIAWRHGAFAEWWAKEVIIEALENPIKGKPKPDGGLHRVCEGNRKGMQGMLGWKDIKRGKGWLGFGGIPNSNP